jgi:hypothetical protein
MATATRRRRIGVTPRPPGSWATASRWPVCLLLIGALASIDYVLSPAGQATLQKWVFISVGSTSVAASGSAGWDIR